MTTLAPDQMLLEAIEEGITHHGGDLGGWTKLEDRSLKLFDGRVTLTAEIHPGDPSNPGIVHAHILTQLHEHDDEVLDACLMGIADTAEEAIQQCAMIWITCVAGPIRSFMDNHPVCMTCQAGVADGDASKGFVPGNYGLPGVRAFVGPAFSRGVEMDAGFDDSMPWFRYATESAAPRRVHIAKSTLMWAGEEGWRRELEIDGHDVSFCDRNWPAQGLDQVGYFLRFAVFEFPRNSKVIPVRAQIEKAIKLWIKNYNKFDDVDVLMKKMEEKGIHPTIVKEVESVSTIAFGRLLFEELGVQYSDTVIRARKNGKVEPNVPLLSLSAYTRAKALFHKLTEDMSEEDIQMLCLYNAESQGIVQILEQSPQGEDLSQISLYPCVVPDKDVSDETMDKALNLLESMIEADSKQSVKKPWWKFW